MKPKPNVDWPKSIKKYLGVSHKVLIASRMTCLCTILINYLEVLDKFHVDKIQSKGKRKYVTHDELDKIWLQHILPMKI